MTRVARLARQIGALTRTERENLATILNASLRLDGTEGPPPHGLDIYRQVIGQPIYDKYGNAVGIVDTLDTQADQLDATTFGDQHRQIRSGTRRVIIHAHGIVAL